jgi:hypothetical protein
MAITYKNEKNASRDIEPLVVRNRVKFRSYRSSELENSESNSILLDLSRIEERLNDTEEKLSSYLRYLNGDSSDYNESVNLQDGLSYEIPGVSIYFDDDNPSLENLEIDTTNKIGSKVFRLMNKISRLEKE